MFDFLAKILIRPTGSTGLQMFRYLFVGAGAFVVDFSVLFLLTSCFGINYLISTPLAFLFGTAGNFVLTKLLVFRQKLSNKCREKIVFFLICAAGLGFTELIMYLLTDLCLIHYMISKVVATVVVFLWNFFAKKLILYKKSQGI